MRIWLNWSRCAVTKVVQKNDGIEVSYIDAQTNSSVQLMTKHVIVAVQPAARFASIAFDPPLSGFASFSRKR
jgi:hypothetical protein